MEPPPQLQGELVSQGKSRQLTNVTIKTVAKHAGVSTATVSRVLSGNGRVSPELQEAVRQSAEALNYSINAVAIALRSSRTATMGMIVPEIDSPAMSRLIQQVVNVLERMDVHLMLSSSQHNARRERLALKSLIARRVDGLIVSPADSSSDLDVLASTALSIPIIHVRQGATRWDIESSRLRHEAVMRRVIDHLKSQNPAAEMVQ